MPRFAHSEILFARLDGNFKKACFLMHTVLYCKYIE